MVAEIDKRGQMSIFVIVAVVIIAVVLLIFLLARTPQGERVEDFDNPESFIDNCAK